MNRRTLLATGAATLGLGVAGCYATMGGDDEGESGSKSSGDSRQDQEVDEPETDPQAEPNESSGENETEPKPENDSANDSSDENETEEQEQEQPAEDRPDALDTIEIVSHDINIEEYPQQDYTETYITGEAETGDYPLANVQIDAAGLDETGRVISHEYQYFATVEANTTLEFEVPLYVDPALLDSYQVSVTKAEYAK